LRNTVAVPTPPCCAGADVLLTDVAAVMPLLKRNYDNNVSPAALRGKIMQCAGGWGKGGLPPSWVCVGGRVGSEGHSNPWIAIVSAGLARHSSVVDLPLISATRQLSMGTTQSLHPTPHQKRNVAAAVVLLSGGPSPPPSHSPSDGS
jgi:hypothetical protein